MSKVMEEIAAYQREFEALVRSWNSQPAERREASWAQYTEMLDQGDAGRHPFAVLLDAVWCNGWDIRRPIEIDTDGLLATA